MFYFIILSDLLFYHVIFYIYILIIYLHVYFIYMLYFGNGNFEIFYFNSFSGLIKTQGEVMKYQPGTF